MECGKKRGQVPKRFSKVDGHLSPLKGCGAGGRRDAGSNAAMLLALQQPSFLVSIPWTLVGGDGG